MNEGINDIDDNIESQSNDDIAENENNTLEGLSQEEIEEAAGLLEDFQNSSFNGNSSDIDLDSYEYRVNGNNQVIYAGGDLKLEHGERNLYAQRIAGGEFRRESDDGGHLIGTRFGGSGELKNLVPEDSHVNRSAFKSIENQWANDLIEGKEVHVDIEPIYHGDSERPDLITAKIETSDNNKTSTDYYSITNENLESEEFEISQDFDDMLDLWNDESDI